MIIKNGTVIDGTGKARYKADVRVEGDKIKDIGDLELRKREKIIDASDRFVVPGFVDMINRSDVHFSLFSNNFQSLIKQGITTILGGSCGASLAPIVSKESLRSIQKWQNISKTNVNWAGTGEFLDEVGRHNPSVNFATLTGHATIRRGLVGDNFKNLSPDALKKAEYLVEKSISEGSFGLSLGLAYSHERIASAGELERLIRVVKKKKGLLGIHLRNEGKDLIPSVEEAVGFARKYKVSTHIYHFKGFGRDAWGMFPRALELIERAREGKINISFDTYPYNTTSSVLYLLLPEWASHGGKKEVLARLRDKDSSAKVIRDLKDKEEDLADIVIAKGDIDDAFTGKSLREIASNQEVSVAEAFVNIILASEDQVIGFVNYINDQNMRMAAMSSAGMIASDGAGYRLQDAGSKMLVHPRSFGAFSRFLRQYAAGENKSLSWEKAIHKISFFPAARIGLKKRGRIAKGYFADIVVLDPGKIRDRSMFQDPYHYAEGVENVMVNGGFALRNGKFQKRRHGQVLRSS